MENITLRAPAKINLALDILGKRGDGYHLVKMIMQTIDLYDTVNISLKDHKNITLISNSLEVPLDEKNIAFKAAKEFFSATNINNPGVEIALYKQIPVAAGLAGGSTNAAAVIVGLNYLFNTNLNAKDLIDIGSKIGADVPFCILGGTMIAEDIGTTLTPLPDMPECYIVLSKPPVSVSTKEAYALHDSIKSYENKSCEAAIEAICNGDIQSLADSLYNKFEKVISLPEVDDIKRIMMSYGALGSCMSGSGPSVFAIFDIKEKAENCACDLKKVYENTYICKPITTGCTVKS